MESIEKNANNENILKYEDYLKELTEIVILLEKGELTLDESIEKYKRALELSKLCKEKLEKAKKEVEGKKVEVINVE